MPPDKAGPGTWRVRTSRAPPSGDSRFLGASYRAGGNTGLALDSPEGDDWVGVWTYAGGTELGKEKWTGG